MTTTLGAAEALADDVVITRELTASVGEVPPEHRRTFRRNTGLVLTHAVAPESSPRKRRFSGDDPPWTNGRRAF